MQSRQVGKHRVAGQQLHGHVRRAHNLGAAVKGNPPWGGNLVSGIRSSRMGSGQKLTEPGPAKEAQAWQTGTPEDPVRECVQRYNLFTNGARETPTSSVVVGYTTVWQNKWRQRMSVKMNTAR